MSEYDRHVGDRIRMYRKNKGMSAAAFADRIHKSISAVSKYENGHISLDLNTLVDAAQALDVTVAQLVDLDLGTGGSAAGSRCQFLQGQSRFYFYFVSGKKRAIHRNILEIEDRGDDPQALIFCRIKDEHNAYDCDYLYHGSIESSDAHFYVEAENQSNSTEKVFLNVVVPFRAGDEAYGIFCALSPRSRLPVSYKVLLSRTPVAEDDMLRKKLIASREEIQDLRTYNDFSIRLYQEE